MAELAPYPFRALVRRMLRELERDDAVFDLPATRFTTGVDGLDLSVRVHGHTASSPLGPAAGPHTQMAQNLALSWLGGSRVFELKTVQILDELTIPRPCIDMRTVGFNAEWSQELRLHESLDEYVKGAMLIAMLTHGAGSAPPPWRDPLTRVRPEPGFDQVVFDMSLGYDLKGIRSDRVQGFIRGMQDARAAVERFRDEIPAEHSWLRGVPFPERLSDTVTLSTFHGCPPEEIERIIEHLMRENGLHCTVKFNPTLLGPVELRRLLHDVLGYAGIRVPDSAFARDTKWEQAIAMMERLGRVASELGLSLGAKFSNTLIVENAGCFLPASEKEVYLSGAPLHVLAMNLVGRFRAHFGNRFPISFAAGIDRRNFPDAAALGLVPITVCSDLLQPQGYGRLAAYTKELARRMGEAGARSLSEWVLRAHGAEAAGRTDPTEALLWNTKRYVEAATANPRYTQKENSKQPKKIGRILRLFDCVTCDKCIPVCPNDANFVFTPPVTALPIVKAVREGAGWVWREEGIIALKEKHQIANFADFCNECGNCDVFCPEDGGPYRLKPRFFGSEAAWRRFTGHDGFFVERRSGCDRVLGRLEGREYGLEVAKETLVFRGEGFSLAFDAADPAGSLAVREEPPGLGAIDLTPCLILDGMRRGVLDGPGVNFVNALADE